MQAFGLMVIDFDGGKISGLAEQLRNQGYSLVTTTLSQTDTPDSGAPALVEEVIAGGDVSSPDNSLPFKCPACGRTYEAQVVCDVQHEPTPTETTGDVLGTDTAAPAAEEPTATATAADGSPSPDAAPALAEASSGEPPAAAAAAPEPATPAEPAPVDPPPPAADAPAWPQ